MEEKKLTGIPSIDYKVNKERVYGIEEDYSMYDIDKSMFEYFVDCVYDKLDDDKRVVNKNETRLVRQKQQLLKDE